MSEHDEHPSNLRVLHPILDFRRLLVRIEQRNKDIIHFANNPYGPEDALKFMEGDVGELSEAVQRMLDDLAAGRYKPLQEEN